MNLAQATGVIMGANIGTTITAQIVAFKVTKYALLMVAGGFGMMMMGRQEKTKHWGTMLLGLGLVFFGMGVMSGAMKPLRSFQPFLDLMVTMENPVIGILIAAAFTGLVQSSSATTGIVIVMATEGLVSLPAGIALAFGANIGTCVTALLASIGKPRIALQASMVHLLFNVFGVVLWFFFIPYLAEFVVWLSPAADASLTGQERLAAEAPRQIANAHTVFNIANTLIFLPLAGVIAGLAQKIVPIKEATVEETLEARFKPMYLDEGMLQSPPLALSMARRETRRMSEGVELMLEGIPAAVFAGNTDKMALLREADDQVDTLYAAISRYLSKLGRSNLSAHDADENMMMATAATEVENIGDIIEIHMSHLANMCSVSNIKFNDEELSSLNDYHRKIVNAFKTAMTALEHDHKDTAEKILKLEDEIIGGMDRLVRERQMLLLQEDHTPQEMVAFTLQTDIMENFKRIYEHTKRIAKLVTRKEGSTAMAIAD